MASGCTVFFDDGFNARVIGRDIGLQQVQTAFAAALLSLAFFRLGVGFVLIAGRAGVLLIAASILERGGPFGCRCGAAGAEGDGQGCRAEQGDKLQRLLVSFHEQRFG